MQQDRAIDRHTQLVKAGSDVVHRQGFQRTLLADVAAEAKVPPGSLYYYFKTREDIAEAIIAERVNHLLQLTQRWDRLATPRARLDALLKIWVEDRDIDSRYGCPIGSLCYELAKRHDSLSEMAAEPLQLLVQWSEQQFREMGQSPRKARDLAMHLLCALQGVSLLANAFGDPQVIVREANQLKRWLRELE